MNALLGLALPLGYQWLLDRALIGHEPFTQLQPWHYLQSEQCFWASERWPKQTQQRLLVFARRQDCDDLACFVVGENGAVSGVALIHGWTASGYDVVHQFPDFWAWLKHVVDDVASWVNSEI